jgi:hypothetical protein
MGKALIMVAGAAGVWCLSGGVAGADPGVPDRAVSYINPDIGLATGNPDVDRDSDCGNPDIVDLQTVGSTNVHVDACLFTAEAPRDADESDVDAPASFQSLGVGFITACPDPDAAGPKTSRLSDTDADGRNDLCAQSGYQNRPGMDGNFEYHARMNSTTPGGQVVLFCHDADADGCLDERVLSVSVIVWLP